MIKCNLRNVSDAVRSKKEFLCNKTLSGKWQPSNKIDFGWIEDGVPLANHLLGSTKNFVVYSYDTPIAVYNHKGWWKNPEKYTTTTSRHMGKIGV